MQLCVCECVCVYVHMQDTYLISNDILPHKTNAAAHPAKKRYKN